MPFEFLDEECETNAFAVGFVEAFKHPTKLYPESVPTNIPENLVEDVKKKYGQYNAGFYIGKIVILGLVIGAAYFGLPQVFTGL